jgi:hypothetical protein
MRLLSLSIALLFLLTGCDSGGSNSSDEEESPTPTSVEVVSIDVTDFPVKPENSRCWDPPGCSGPDPYIVLEANGSTIYTSPNREDVSSTQTFSFTTAETFTNLSTDLRVALYDNDPPGNPDDLMDVTSSVRVRSFADEIGPGQETITGTSSLEAAILYDAKE